MTVVVALLGVSTWYFKPTPKPKVALVEAPAAPVETAPAPLSLPADSMPRPPRHAPKQRIVVKTGSVAPPTTLAERWGIEVSSMRLSMGNSAVDLRYKVLDPAKAALLGNGKTASYIIDRSTGKRLIMPTPPKEGAFPPTAHKLLAGKTYFSMVSNQGGALKSGSQVTVVVGGSEATNLTIQ